jgi:protein-disulfide isomerase
LLFDRPLSRRAVLALTGSVTAVLALGVPPSMAQRKQGPAEVPVEELMKPGELPDLAIGSPDAKVVIVEYASMTCGHCANFHNKVLPELKTKYIDNGKVRLVMREFPLDNLAAGASMLTRCAGGGDKSVGLIETFFKLQSEWAFKEGNPVPRLFEIAKQAGFTQESFDKCLTDQKLLDQITAVRTRGAEVFGVSATPTFFINGKRLQGSSLADFEKALEPLLAEK